MLAAVYGKYVCQYDLVTTLHRCTRGIDFIRSQGYGSHARGHVGKPSLPNESRGSPSEMRLLEGRTAAEARQNPVGIFELSPILSGCLLLAHFGAIIVLVADLDWAGTDCGSECPVAAPAR